MFPFYEHGLKEARTQTCEHVNVYTCTFLEQ